jgi:hypothetical protein
MSMPARSNSGRRKGEKVHAHLPTVRAGKPPTISRLSGECLSLLQHSRPSLQAQAQIVQSNYEVQCKSL